MRVSLNLQNTLQPFYVLLKNSESFMITKVDFQGRSRCSETLNHYACFSNYSIIVAFA